MGLTLHLLGPPEVILDGESVLNQEIPIGKGGAHELIIICE